MAGYRRARFLARGSAASQPGDEDILSLIPVGEWMLSECVRDQLAGHLFDQLWSPTWGLDDAWMVLPWVCQVDAQHRLADALCRGVLVEQLVIHERLTVRPTGTSVRHGRHLQPRREAHLPHLRRPGRV